MLKKTIRRLGALAMVLAMAVSVFAVSTSAAGTEEKPTRYDEIKEATFDKTVNNTQSGFTYNPVTQFTFTVTPATATKKTDTTAAETYAGAPVYDGVAGGVTVENPAEFTLTGTKTQKGKFTFDTTKFTKPGIYKYTVTEEANNYDGVTIDSTPRTLYVFVQNNSTNTGYEVYSTALVYTNAKGEQVKNGAFVNNYDTYTLKVGKHIAGTAANLGAKFHITVKITGATGEKYTTNKDVELEANSETGYTFELGQDEYVEIYGLSKGDSYIVTEEESGKDGYETSGEVTAAKTMESSMKNGVATVTVNNVKDAASPTGVIMTIAPYALMVVLAGAFAVVFLSRRNRAE